MYYGGEPPAWTNTPSIPPEAMYKAEAEKRDVQASTSGDSLSEPIFTVTLWINPSEHRE